jgi:hypothetical protein
MPRLKKLAFCDEATKEAAQIAFQTGWQAHENGVGIHANPYKSGTGDELEQRKYNQWRFGWGEAQGRKRFEAGGEAVDAMNARMAERDGRLKLSHRPAEGMAGVAVAGATPSCPICRTSRR